MTLKERWSGAERVRYVFGYDWRNRMNEVEARKGTPAMLSHIVRYGYDAQGSRAWREKLDSRGERVAFEKYSYNGANALADYDMNNNATARYAMNGVDGLLYVQRGMKKYFYHTNHLGSVVAITDEDGDVVNRYLYTDSWGNFRLSCPSVNKGKPCIPNRYIYTGREWDADRRMCSPSRPVFPTHVGVNRRKERTARGRTSDSPQTTAREAAEARAKPRRRRLTKIGGKMGAQVLAAGIRCSRHAAKSVREGRHFVSCRDRAVRGRGAFHKGSSERRAGKPAPTG